ncbi:unnamed protein product, partial [Laminaria digitata]
VYSTHVLRAKLPNPQITSPLSLIGKTMTTAPCPGAEQGWKAEGKGRFQGPRSSGAAASEADSRGSPESMMMLDNRRRARPNRHAQTTVGGAILPRATESEQPQDPPRFGSSPLRQHHGLEPAAAAAAAAAVVAAAAAVAPRIRRACSSERCRRHDRPSLNSGAIIAKRLLLPAFSPSSRARGSSCSSGNPALISTTVAAAVVAAITAAAGNSN